MGFIVTYFNTLTISLAYKRKHINNMSTKNLQNQNSFEAKKVPLTYRESKFLFPSMKSQGHIFLNKKVNIC